MHLLRISRGDLLPRSTSRSPRCERYRQKHTYQRPPGWKALSSRRKRTAHWCVASAARQDSRGHLLKTLQSCAPRQSVLDGTADFVVNLANLPGLNEADAREFL